MAQPPPPSWLELLIQGVTSQIPGIIAGGILGPLVLELLRRPWLAMKFRADECISRTTERGSTMGPARRACYLRMKVVNRTWRTAKNCKAYLVKIEKQGEGGGQYASTTYLDAMQLAWSAKGTKENALRGIDLPKGVPQFFDIVSVRENSSDFRPEVEGWLYRDETLPKEKGTFRVTVYVAGDNMKPRKKRVCFSWDGNIENFTAWSA